MSLSFVFDEDTRDSALWGAVLLHNQDSADETLDIVRVGDANGPAISTQDPDLVIWACSSGRIIVSHDENTLVGHHNNYVRQGNSTPGLLVVKKGASIPDIVESLTLIAHYAEPHEYASAPRWIPE